MSRWSILCRHPIFFSKFPKAPESTSLRPSQASLRACRVSLAQRLNDGGMPQSSAKILGTTGSQIFWIWGFYRVKKWKDAISWGEIPPNDKAYRYQTWRWELPEPNGGFNGKITCKWWMFHCHVRVPEGIPHIVGCMKKRIAGYQYPLCWSGALVLICSKVLVSFMYEMAICGVYSSVKVIVIVALFVKPRFKASWGRFPQSQPSMARSVLRSPQNLPSIMLQGEAPPTVFVGL